MIRPVTPAEVSRMSAAREFDPEHPIRVVHVVFGLGVGGLENGLVNLVSGTDPERFDHTVLCMKTLGPNAARLEAAGARVELVGRLHSRNLLIIPKLYRRLRRLRPHIVHTRNFGTVDAIVAARLARIRVVVHGEHGWDTADMDGTSRRRRRVRLRLASRIRRFIAVSEHIGSWLADHGDAIASKVTVIHNGVDIRRFAAERRCRASPEDFTIGTAGRFAPVKDQASLIEAFNRLATDFPRARLLIVGEGDLDEQLHTAARTSEHQGRIEIRPTTPDMPEVYREMDLFALPSLNEGISNTILEAMASGLPVVASSVGGNPELVVEGVTGTLVEPARPGRLADAMKAYLARPELAMAHGTAGCKRATEHFSLERMQTAYERLYTDVLRA
jgi:sugar transferase (PEP-CTERM/EpsH1 system associated)